MRVFLDTEFTDFSNPRLLSVGLVAEDGREYYCEISDGWQMEHCNPFVVEVVLPLLDRNPATIFVRDEAGAGIIAWLRTIAPSVTVIYDTDTDWRLLSVLLWPHPNDGVNILEERLSWPGFAMAQRSEDLLEEILDKDPRRHHALVDARALCKSVLQTEVEFRISSAAS
jgi:hypothetical protein